MTDQAPWITFRPEIKVLDCTVRDGGLINDSKFDDSFVRAVRVRENQVHGLLRQVSGRCVSA